MYRIEFFLTSPQPSLRKSKSTYNFKKDFICASDAYAFYEELIKQQIPCMIFEVESKSITPDKLKRKFNKAVLSDLK